MPLFLSILGTALGIFMGAIPGLTGAMLIALLLPVTFYMDPFNAVVLIVGIYVGAVSGGLITAITLRIPGTVSNLMTMLDGYPMAREGKAGRAIALSVMASLAGGILSWVVLASMAEPLSRWATRFTAFDYFALVMLAMAFVIMLSQGAMLKGLLSGALGFLCTLPGIDPSSAQARMTFGLVELNAGIPLLAFFVGMFAFGALLTDIANGAHERASALPAAPEGTKRLAWSDMRLHWKNGVRSSVIGTGVGILPGIGSNIASVVAYSVTRSFSKKPERFGHGAEEGLVASEAANNAAVGGALIPTLALGIPGSLVDILLLTALIIHSLQPGPLLFINSGELAYGIIATYLIATIAMAAIMMLSVRWLTEIGRWKLAYLIPLILVASVIGAFAMDGNTASLWIMVGFGILGFWMERLGYPLAPFAIAFVLGPIAEARLRTGLQITGGDWSPLYTTPLPIALFGLAFLLMVAGPIKRAITK